MTTIAIVQIAVLLLLGLAALAPGTFFAMLLLGGAAAGALRYWGWDWTVALQMGLAGALCLPALRIFAAGRLLAAGVVIIAVPALLISRLGLGATWTHSALYAVVRIDRKDESAFDDVGVDAGLCFIDRPVESRDGVFDNRIAGVRLQCCVRCYHTALGLHFGVNCKTKLARLRHRSRTYTCSTGIDCSFMNCTD